MLFLRNILRRYKLPIGVYVGVALLVMGPLLWPGFVLTMDMVFTPTIHMPVEIANDYPLFALLSLLNMIVPADILQKTILITILLASGIGAHRLAGYIGREIGIRLAMLQYFGGLVYMVNPFVYSRFMAGQYLVLAAYALLPWAVWALLRFVRQPCWRTVWPAIILTVSMGVVSLHGFGFVLLLGIIAGGVWSFRRCDRRTVMWGGVFAVSVVVLSSYWLLPSLMGKGSTAIAIDRFTAADLAAFATLGEGFVQKTFHVVTLQGFWLESREMYTLPQEVMPLWLIGSILLVALAMTGLMVVWRRSRRQAVFWGVILLTGIVMATGVLQAPLQALLPVFAGYREPQKFVALIALSYLVLAPFGAWWGLQRLREHWPTTHAIASGFVYGLPLILAPTMVWGFAGQLKPRQYPAGWSVVNQRLKQDGGDFTVLSLPWHHYMSYGFAGRLIANPTQSFMDKPIVISQDPEIEGATSGKEDYRQQQIGAILLHPKDKQFATKLAAFDIKYIVVAKELDYRQFDYLAHHQDFTPIITTESIILYRNIAKGD